MVPQAGFGILEVLDVPVILVKGVVNERGVLLENTHPQKHEGRHEQGIRPGLLGEVVLGGDGVLKHVISKTQGVVFQVIHLLLDDLPVLFVTGGLVKRQHGVAHGAGVHRKDRKAQLDVFLGPGFEHVQVFFLSRGPGRPR